MDMAITFVAESIGCVGDWTGRDGLLGSCGACCVAASEHWHAPRVANEWTKIAGSPDYECGDFVAIYTRTIKGFACYHTYLRGTPRTVRALVGTGGLLDPIRLAKLTISSYLDMIPRARAPKGA